MVEGLEILSTGDFLHVKVIGKLTKEFYEDFAPIVDKQIEEQGKLRVVFEMHDFHGWTAGALWEDIKFDFRHWKDIERLAIVGESKWEQGMAVFCKPFLLAKVKYFDLSKRDDALSWVGEE